VSGSQGATSRLPRPQNRRFCRISVRLNELIFVRIDPQGASFVFEPGARRVIDIDTRFSHIPALAPTPGPHTFCTALLPFNPPLKAAIANSSTGQAEINQPAANLASALVRQPVSVKFFTGLEQIHLAFAISPLKQAVYFFVSGIGNTGSLTAI